MCLGRALAADNQVGKRPMLCVPMTIACPVMDGKLDEPCWQEAARTGPLKVPSAATGSPITEAFLLRDADHLCVGIRCTEVSVPDGDVETGTPAKAAEFIELLIDSNGDGNSYYRIRLSPENGGQIVTSYHELSPPWHDRTWQPQFKFAAAKGTDAWTAEFALPFGIFCKNKTLAGEIGFNVRHSGPPGQEPQSWQGTSAVPGDWGLLTGIPARENLPEPDYAKPKPDPSSSGAQWNVTVYAPPSAAQRSALAEQRAQTIQLGPGSAHPGTTGQVRLEFEGFLLAGDPHARGIIWDLAVNEQRGELYVLSDPRRVREAPELRVFDRQGRYLRTIMPFNPTLPRSRIQDLCQKMAREGGTELVVPKLFETLCGSLSLYGAWWHLPQKMAVAPNDDLILGNIYRGTLWRMQPDGGLPLEGWTSIYHPGRNEPFESHNWTQDFLNAQDLQNYLPFNSLHYPYFCFDRSGSLYISAGQSSRPTKQYAYHWEVSQQEVTYRRELPGKEGRGAYVWKSRMHPGIKVEEQDCFPGFAGPSGLAVDGSHLIVADSGNNRLQVLADDGRVAASITHYEHDGKKFPLHGPTALAMDHEKSLYILVAPQDRSANEPVVERTLPVLQQDYLLAAQKGPGDPTKLIKLKSWREPRLVAVSAPLDPDVVQIAVDGGVSPPLVWVANGSGPGSLLQLAGDDLSLKAQWADDGETLSCPRQSGNQAILNIDPQTGDLYVEDDSNYRIKQYGTVYRLDQTGKVLKKWPPVFFNDLGLRATSPWWPLDYERHSRYPEEPLFIDTIFGKDGRVYRWKLGKAGVEILRFDRAGKPLPFAATGTNALFVDPPMQVNFWHDVYHGLEVDRRGNLYYVAKADADPKARPISAYHAVRRQVNVYDAEGNLQTRGLLRLDAVRGLQVDDEGSLYALHRPAERPWDNYLALSKFPPTGGEPLWSRPWDGYIGQAQVIFAPCHCITSRQHQTLDGKGYLYAAGKHSVQVIDCATGQLIGEFGSYGNMDCQSKGSRFPHPELPFGIISALSVWKDRLFVVDVLNRRIVKCRIVYGQTGECSFSTPVAAPSVAPVTRAMLTKGA
jgi:sugar lactone lactonase YvrE